MELNQLKLIRKELGFTQSEMAEKLGIKQGSYSDIERGKSTITRSLELLIIYRFSINEDWLASGKGSIFQKDSSTDNELSSIKETKTELNADKLKKYIELGKSNAKFDSDQPNKSQINSSVVSLPIVGEIAAGNPFEVADMSDLGNIIVSTELISDPDNFYCFRVNGWSMSPEIQHSDVVIINKLYDYDDMDNRIVAIRIDDGITLKLLKLDHDNKCSWLMPINDDYKPILINQYSTIIILGVLEYSIRSYK